MRGQVHGGVVQGAGQAFGEEAIYDPDSGQLLSGTFTDYTMPRAGLIGSILSESHPVPTALNALGAKGVGESGCSGSLPALGNAMADALRGNGIAPDDRSTCRTRRRASGRRSGQLGNRPDPGGQQHSFGLGRRHRLAVEIALPLQAAFGEQCFMLAAGFDALGDDRQAQAAGKRDDGPHQRKVLAVLPGCRW